ADSTSNTTSTGFVAYLPSISSGTPYRLGTGAPVDSNSEFSLNGRDLSGQIEQIGRKNLQKTVKVRWHGFPARFAEPIFPSRFGAELAMKFSAGQMGGDGGRHLFNSKSFCEISPR